MANTKITSKVIADDAILTANIADDQVTADKLANAINTSIAAKLPLAGGTMTGNIVMGDDTSIGIADDAERIEFDGAGDISLLGANVGIGTTSPTTKLHLGGTAPLDSIIRQDSTSSGTNWEIGERAAGKWQIFEDDNDSIVATFMSTGNVGIGTASPDARLDIEHPSLGQAANLGETRSKAGFILNSDTGYGSNGLTMGECAGTAGSYFIGVTNSGGSASYPLNLQPYGGNVGIGTASPATTLNIQSATPIFRGTDSDDVDKYGQIEFNNGDIVISADANSGGGYHGASKITFCVDSGGEKMRITNDGKVGIGDTSPSYTLDVLASSGTAANFRGEGGPNGILIGGNDAGFGWLGSTGHANYDLAFNNSGYAHFGHGESTTFLYLGSQGGGWGGNSSHNLRSSGATFMFNSGSGNYLFEIGGVQKGYINASGFNSGSDVSLKENIADISYGLETVKLLKPRKFDWKDAPADDKAEIGFVAQEVESIIPEIISESRSDGEGTSIKGMNYGALTAVLTKAIQELTTKLETAEARIKTLEDA